MAENSKIEWTHHTFNPWRGCTKVSAGCANCYAETLSGRNPKTLGVWGPRGTRVVAAESQWRLPLKWDREAKAAGVRARVFCASLADVFEGPETMPPQAWPLVRAARVRLHHLINETPNLDWLLLTKRPENIRRFAESADRSWTENMPPNVGLGTSVENQETADARIPELVKIPARVRFLSCEPLLGPLDFFHGPNDWGQITGIDWVIVGGESGAGARPCRVEWVRSIAEQCKAAGVACFVKQLGSHPVAEGAVRGNDAHDGPGTHRETYPLSLRDRKGGDVAEFPADLRVREFPV